MSITAQRDVMLDSGGESVEVNPMALSAAGGFATCIVHQELPDSVEIRIKWGTNAAGQAGSATLCFHHDGQDLNLHSAVVQVDNYLICTSKNCSTAQINPFRVGLRFKV